MVLDRDDVGEQRFEVSNSQVICAVPRGWVATHARLIESAHGVGTWSVRIPRRSSRLGDASMGPRSGYTGQPYRKRMDEIQNADCARASGRWVAAKGL